MKTISQLLEKAEKYSQSLPALPCKSVIKAELSSYLDCALHDPAATPDQPIITQLFS